MKKNVVILIFMVFLCVFSYFLGLYSNKRTKGNSSENTQISVIDYPLIDISFDDKSNWFVIVRTNLFTENEKYYVSQNIKSLNLNKEKLIISTFPVGRGTTPQGIIYVYKNCTLIKEVPFINISFKSQIFKSQFEYMTKKDVEKIINASLPSPV
ncbi:MAG: hypothetical protein J5874_04885 [Oscillospiraceae bacterium]|nr:hypothetical protein [Oscillospiraceae bacterium]